MVPGLVFIFLRSRGGQSHVINKTFSNKVIENAKAKQGSSMVKTVQVNVPVQLQRLRVNLDVGAFLLCWFQWVSGHCNKRLNAEDTKV
jgi:hypothetical protein